MRRTFSLSPLLLVPTLASLLLAPNLAWAQSAETPVPTPSTSSLDTAGGKVAIHYYPVALPGKSLQEHQRVGNVWSMGEREAAVLQTDIALAAGTLVIPPGRYRLSSWYRKKDDWQLLVFAKGENYRSGTPYRGVPLQYRDLSRAAEILRFELVERRGAIRLELYAGTTRLRATFEPLHVVKHKGTIAGRPATFEFYRWAADFRIQNHLREYKLVQFGRVRRDGEFGAVYDISCKSDGAGIFVMCHSTSLQDNREHLVARTKALRASPGDAKLTAEIGALRTAIAEQEQLQPSVMLAGTVELVNKKTPVLEVQPVLDSDGTAFELSFGLRRAKFVLNDSQFRKLSWR